jgi:hypothetical protein
MNQTEALELARIAMDSYGLNTWTLQIDRAKRRLGYCRFPTATRPGVISLSAYMIEHSPWIDIQDTV